MGRAAVARLLALGIVAVGALFVAPSAHAIAPAAPTVDRPQDTADYYGGGFITGTKQVATVIELEMDDGRKPPCSNGNNLVFSSFQCNVDADYLWPRPSPNDYTEVVNVYSVDPPTGDRSAPTPVTITLSQSRFDITSPLEVPSGDVVTFDGDREYGTTVDWMVESDTKGIIFSDEPCATPADVEDRVFRCTWDTRTTPPRSGAKALAMVVPDGEYEGTFTEFQGTQIIDQISFLFTVGGGAPPPTPPGPPAPPDPPEPPDPDPTDVPTTPDGGGDVGGGDGPGPTTPTTTPPAVDPATTPSADPSSTTDPTPTAGPTPTSTPTVPPVEPEDEVAAAPPAVVPGVDILPLLVLAVMVFTVLGTIGVPGLGLGGRFAPGSTRTGGGQVPVGRWPAEDAAAARTATHRSGSAGLIGLAAGEVGAADEAVRVDAGSGAAWGDRSVTWRAPGHELVDELSAMLPLRLAPRWPLLARLVADGSPVRAILGSLSVLLPVAGLVLGVAGGLTVDGPFAPALGITVVLLAIGLADAVAGTAAVVGFSVTVAATGSLAAGDVTLGDGLRGLVGVAALWFVVPLVAGAARPFRRTRAAGQVYAWDRVADTAIAALLCGWVVQGLVGSLDDLVGRTQPLTEHADAMAMTTIGLVVGRFGIEEVAARGYPLRLSVVHATTVPTEPSVLVQLRGVVVRSAFLAFFAWAFIGSCWQLWAGVAVFSLPYVLALVHQQLPDARPLALALPRGVVETLVLVVVGGALAFWVDAGVGDAARGSEALQGLRNGFVVLAVPAAAIGVLGVLGGEPPVQKWTWPRQLAGAAVVAATVLLVLLWL